METPCVRLLVPVLIGTLFAACSPTREVARPLTAGDFKGVNHYAIDNELYYKLALQGDTLVCRLRTRISPYGDRERIPLTLDDAVQGGLDRDKVIILEFHPDATLLSSGDTLYIPIQALDVSRLHETNPAFVAGAVIGTAVGVTTVVLVVMALSLTAGIVGLLTKLAGR